MRGLTMGQRRRYGALAGRSPWCWASPRAARRRRTTANTGGSGEETANSAPAEDCGKVTINENAWAGSTANVYIAKAVLEDSLGCEVEITKIAEIPVFQAMADGKVDAVLEDWQHTDEYEKFIEKAGTVVDGGLGVEGHIGWFIPKYLMDEHPEFETWEGLKGKEDLFKTPSPATRACSSAATRLRAEGQGAHRGARPQLQARDGRRGAGAGRALDAALQAGEAGHLLLVHAAVLQPGVRPGRGEGARSASTDCKDDAKAGGDVEQYKCAYDVTVIEKLFSKKFADSGSPAFDVLSKMELTNDDQEAVAKAIAGDKEDPEDAAQAWIEENQDTVESWLGQQRPRAAVSPTHGPSLAQDGVEPAATSWPEPPHDIGLELEQYRLGHG